MKLEVGNYYSWNDDVIDKIPLTQSVLKIHLAELVFRYSDRLVLSDFKAAPDLSNLNDGTLTKRRP